MPQPLQTAKFPHGHMKHDARHNSAASDIVTQQLLLNHEVFRAEALNSYS